MVNRVLAVMCVAGLLFLLLRYLLPVAQEWLAVISILSAFVLHLFPGLRELPKLAIFATSEATIMLVMALVLTLLLFLRYEKSPAVQVAATPIALEPTVISFATIEYTLGGQDGEGDEVPAMTLTIAAFSLGVTEVTNAEYGRFVNDGGYLTDAYWSDVGRAWRDAGGITEPAYWSESALRHPDQPVVGVSWFEAEAYTRWLSARSGRVYRLPTEAEWEQAACGWPKRVYPWGNEWNGQQANFADKSAGSILEEVTWADMDADDGYAMAAPVGRFPLGATPEGLLDLGGNVWEWTATPYTPYGADYPLETTGTHPRVKRGGGWGSVADHLRCANRASDDEIVRANNLGFRVVLEMLESR